MESVAESNPGSRQTRVRRFRGLLVIAAGVTVVCATAAAYLVMGQQRQKDCPPRTKASQVAESAAEDGDQDFWREDLQRQTLRRRLHELVKRADRISGEIDSLESEMEAYEREYDKLLDSEAGRRLMEDERAVAYLAGGKGSRLPDKAVAKQFQTRLDELMVPIREAVATREGAFEVPQRTIQSIERIAFEVSEVRHEYKQGRKLLQALIQLGSEESVDDFDHDGNRPGDEGSALLLEDSDERPDEVRTEGRTGRPQGDSAESSHHEP